MPASVKSLNEFTALCKKANATELRVKKVQIPNTDKIFIKLKLRTSTRLYTLSMKDIGLAMKFANNIKKANKGIRVRFFKY
eukprot:gnl/Chilomastix_caulleri/2300.p1 GENE.gnl/Chilomastix_caulleri/2300~~gnl/Chilomastix_caulleri/2300.p1  ORF type:complete len:81 (+),score=20.44 gnl/Chilomastix_caulleri/2300:43-285(+)